VSPYQIDPSTSEVIVGPPDMVMPGSEVLLFRAGVLLVVVGLVVLAASALRWVLRRRRGRPARSRVGVVAGVSVLVVGVVLSLVNRPPPFFTPEFPALPRLLPEAAFFYRQADELPRHPDSSAQVAALGGLPIVPSASATARGGVVWGKPFNFVDDRTPRHRFRFHYAAGSDHVEYPISEPAYIQSMPNYGFDDHYIGLDLEAREMWEIITIRDWFGVWSGTAGAHWDLDDLRYPRGRTTASGLPILPGLFTWAEVDAGEVPHVITVTSPVSGRDRWTWPARYTDGVSDDPSAPPMGTWLRLRDDADLSGLGPQATVIARALQTYGAVIADTGPNFTVHGTPDARWDDADLATLQQIHTDDFEVVDAAGLMVSAESMEARSPERP
jgi:hypothetical protein